MNAGDLEQIFFHFLTKERERQRHNRDTDTHRHRHTDTQTDTQTHTETQTHTDTRRDTHTETHTQTKTVRVLKLQKISNRVPTRKVKLIYFHQNQLPTSTAQRPHLFLERNTQVPFLKRLLKKPTGDGCHRRMPQPEAGKGSRMLPGLSAKVILFSLPTSACQPGIFLVVMWRRACFVRWSLRMKRRSHTGHTNFFSPV